MYIYYKTIEEKELIDIHKFEEEQLLKFKNEYDELCSKIAKLNGFYYSISIKRWIDVSCKWFDCSLDGYTATLQIDFTNNIGEIIENDENYYSFFENITYISFNPLLRRYKVFQNEQLGSIRKEISYMINNLQ